MKSKLKSTAVVLLAVFAMVSCAPDGSGRGLPLGPSESGETARVETSSITSYTRITEQPPEGVPLLELSQVIGLLGGELTIAGHTLTVPAGAVTVPTLFTTRVLRNGYIEVELTAVVNGLLGSVINVGAQGFRRPVTVTLTYARATNVTDPSRLKIMRLKSNGRHEILPSTVDQNRKTVSAQLDHFSRYCVISD